MSISRQPLIMLTVIFLLMLPLLPVHAAEADSVLNVSIDNEQVEYQASTVKSLVFLSAEDVTASLGGTLEYDATKKSLTITYKETKATLDLGSSTIVVNGEKLSLDAAPMLLEEVVVIPAKAVPIIWGVSIGWNEEDLSIRTDGEEVIMPDVSKVVVEKATLLVNEKETNVSYISIPADAKLKADVVVAQNCIGKVETLEKLAERSYAEAAINGNYFQSYDPSKAMEPYGLIVKKGALLHAENTGGTIAFFNDGSIKVGVAKSVIKADLNGTKADIAMLNHTPAKDGSQIVLFNNFHGDEVGFAYGTNVVVQKGVVTAIEQNTNTAIPEDGYVLNFTGSQEELAEKLAKDNLISYQVSYVNGANEKLDWSEVHTAIGAGPILLSAGETAIDPEREGFVDLTGFGLATARSAIGYTAENNLILVAGVKCTLTELAVIMSQLGAVDALALDAGSVSGSYVKGEYLATPGKEISTALIFR